MRARIAASFLAIVILALAGWGARKLGGAATSGSETRHSDSERGRQTRRHRVHRQRKRRVAGWKL